MTEKKERKIAILGTTPSRMQAPIGDESWEIWTIGPGGKDAHRWDRLFETHNVWPLNFGELADDKSYLDDLSKIEPPQILHATTDMPAALRRWADSHGKDEAFLKANVRGDWKAQQVLDPKSVFEIYPRAWFQSSIDYCLYQAFEECSKLDDRQERLAMLANHEVKQPKRSLDRIAELLAEPKPEVTIGLWGIDLESGEEYISQHWSCKIWIAFCRLAGFNVILPEGCGLERDVTPYPDRYETNFAQHCEGKVNYLTQLRQQAESQLENDKRELYRCEGILMILRELANTQKLPEAERLQQAEQAVAQNTAKVWQVHGRFNQIQGEMNSMKHIRARYTWGHVELD